MVRENFIILIIFFQKKLVALNRKIREINSKITSNFNEGITGAKSIKTLVVENKINHDFDVDSDDMEMLSELFMVATNNAMKQVDEVTEKKMSKFGNIPGLF